MKAEPGIVLSAEESLRRMTAADLETWGVQDIAFAKKVVTRGGIVWSIHAANGAEMGTSADRELAFAAIRQHDLEPYSAH